MIDFTQCFYEDFHFDPVNNEGIYYFTYPKSLGTNIRNFNIEYGEFFACCICVILPDSDDPYDWSVAIAATVSEDDGDSITDVDWNDLIPDVDYNPTDLNKMLENLKF